MNEWLTAREREVLTWLATGKSDGEIAKTLHLSPRTVRHYTNALYAKLDVRNRVEAVLMAQRAGLVEPPTDKRRADTTALCEGLG